MELDNPFFLSIAFHPRRHPPTTCSTFQDGTLPIPSTEHKLGYRCHFAPPESNKYIVYFHGNAEIAADYNNMFLDMDYGLIVFDYRGYGWSTGSPLLSRLLPDIEIIPSALASILPPSRIPPSFVLFGRSIGSVCAIHLAFKYPQSFQGLIIESGLTALTNLPLVQELAASLPNGHLLLAQLPDIFENYSKMNKIELPLLVLLGEKDEIVPVREGKCLYEANPTLEKKQLKIFQAGHNDLVLRYHSEYYAVIQQFLQDLRSQNFINLQQLFNQQDFSQVVQATRDKLRNEELTKLERLRLSQLLCRSLLQLQEYNAVISESSIALSTQQDLDCLIYRAKALQKMGKIHECNQDVEAITHLLQTHYSLDNPTTAAAVVIFFLTSV